MARAVASSCRLSRSKTRRASGSSPAVTSSPVRQRMFSTPWSAAPAMSACSASRLRSRQTSCITGSIPRSSRAMATATGDACACAAVLSVALTASTYGSNGSNRSLTASRSPPSTARSSAVTTRRPALSAASSLDIPPRRCLVVAAGYEVPPRRRAPEAVVDGRADVVELRRPRQAPGALVRLQPNALHLGLHLTAAVGPNAAARAVAHLLRAVHRAGQPCRVEDALPAHAAPEDRPLDRLLDDRQRAHQAGIAALRRRS